MIYEYRSYEAAEGKLADLSDRFAGLTVRLFAAHGFELVGFWQPVDTARLTYLLRWQDQAARDKGWKDLGADPGWIAGKAKSEENGPLVAKVATEIWSPTSYSPLQ